MKQSIIGILTLLIALMMWMQRPTVAAYDYRDCEYFILNHFSNTHYTECLKNPYNYAHYFVYYTVTFTSDSSTISSQSIRRGQNAIAPSIPAKVGHTFHGWDQGFTNVQSNITVNAVWIRSQKVTFLDYNGTVLKEQFVEQGQSATAPNVQARTGYEFTGWNGNFTTVMQDVTVMATYRAIAYQVTFFHENGDVYQTTTTTYNGSVQPPTAPVVVGKTFTQWSITTNQVQSNLSVYAMYDINRYTVRFLDAGNVVKEQLVNHGQDATPPTMSKTGHLFGGWSTSYANIQATMDVTAQWTKELYDVYFYHPSGTLLSHQSVPYMEEAIPPVYTPAVGVTFVAWDTPTTQITSSVHVHPVEQVASYAVYFMDGDQLLVSQVVEHGQACQLFNAVKEGHDFTGWDQSCDNVTTDRTLRAQFNPHQYRVLFYDFLNTVVKEQLVDHGQAATPPDTNFPNYRFTGWNESFSVVTKDLVVRPLGELRTYQAVFKNYEGTTLCTRIVAFNDVVSCPEPKKVGHLFTGWSESLTIQHDITIFAQFTPMMFQVDFYVDNVLAKSEMVRYNFDATPPQVNLQEFDFTGWNGTYQKVTQDQRVDAVIRRREYVVVFKVDETTVKEVSVLHGQDAIPPGVVLKKGHQFVRWIEEFTNVTTHRAIQAAFVPMSFDVTFVVQGSPYTVITTEYMKPVTPPLVQIDGYELIGWRGELDAIEQDTSIYAILRPKTYMVTFLDEGDVVHQEEVTHGQSATAPDNGPWDQSFASVTKSMTIQRLTQDQSDSLLVEPIVLPSTTARLQTLLARLTLQGSAYRYTFDVNLAEYELVDVLIGGQPLDDLSILRFQRTNVFRRDVRWLELENPNQETIEFQLRHLETMETIQVIAQQEEAPSGIVPQQWWLSIVSFFQRLIR